METLLAGFNPLTALAAFLPLGVEAGKALIQRYIAPDQVKPLTFQDWLQVQQMQLEQWKAMQGGDAPSYPWVAAIRQLQRPFFVSIIVTTWCVQVLSAGQASDAVTNMASAAGFYLFGDRTLFYIKGKP